MNKWLPLGGIAVGVLVAGLIVLKQPAVSSSSGQISVESSPNEMKGHEGLRSAARDNHAVTDSQDSESQQSHNQATESGIKSTDTRNDSSDVVQVGATMAGHQTTSVESEHDHQHETEDAHNQVVLPTLEPEIATQVAELESRSTDGLTETPLANGGYKMDFQNSFRRTTVAAIADNGETVVAHGGAFPKDTKVTNEESK